MKPHPAIYFQHWNAGLFNQVLSLEVACGLQAVLQRPIIVGSLHDRGGLFHRQRSEIVDEYPILTSFPECRITDFLEGIPPSLHCSHEVLPIRHMKNTFLLPLDRSVVELPNTYDDTYREAFIDGRNVVSLDQLLGLQVDLLATRSIAWYSRVFMGRTPLFSERVAKLSFADEFRALAESIAKDLSLFNGAHLRCTDFPEKIFRLAKETVLSELRVMSDLSGSLVVSSDQWEHPLARSICSALGSRIIRLEHHILTEYGREFEKLRVPNHVGLAVVVNLILGYSRNFKATPGSSFSGYIHRQIAKRGGESWDFFGSLGCSERTHLPSWSGSIIHRSVRNWWREWPEYEL